MIVCGCRVRLATNSSDRWAGDLGEVADDVFDQHLLLRAEAAADPGLDHPDVLDLPVEQRSDHPTGVERHLGRRADHHAFVLVEPRDRDVRLDRALLDLVDPEGLLEHPVTVRLGGGDRRVDIAALGGDVVDDVAVAVVDLDGVGFVVDDRRTRQHRLALVENRRQDLVGDVDQSAGLLGDVDALGRDDCDPVADVAHLVVEAHLVVRVRVRPTLAARGVLDPRGVAVVEDGVDAGQCPGPGVVDGDDAGVGVRAAQHLGVEHAAQFDVVGERRVALGETHRVDLDLGASDDRHLGDVARRHQSGHGRGSVRHRRRRVVVDARRTVGHRRDHQRAKGPRCLTPAHRCSSAHRLDGLHVGRLPIEDAREHVADLGFGRVRRAVEEGERAEHHRPGRVAGLERPDRHEGRLDRMEVRSRVQRLDGHHPVPVGLCRQNDVARDQLTVEQHGTGTGLTAVGSEAHAEHPGPAQHRAQ